LASFVYTALGESEIELSLINWDSRNTYNESIYPALESITINQTDPAVQQMMSSASTMSETATSQEELPISQEDIDGIVDWLEELWSKEKEIRDAYTRKEWEEFIDSVRDSY
jgi:hypothetical protein